MIIVLTCFPPFTDKVPQSDSEEIIQRPPLVGIQTISPQKVDQVKQTLPGASNANVNTTTPKGPNTCRELGLSTTSSTSFGSIGSYCELLDHDIDIDTIGSSVSRSINMDAYSDGFDNRQLLQQQMESQKQIEQQKQLERQQEIEHQEQVKRQQQIKQQQHIQRQQIKQQQFERQEQLIQGQQQIKQHLSSSIFEKKLTN